MLEESKYFACPVTITEKISKPDFYKALVKKKRKIQLYFNEKNSSSRIANSQSSKTLIMPGCCASCDKMSLTGSIVRKPTLHRYISTKVLLAEGTDSSFTRHCHSYEHTYQGIQVEIQNLKDEVQELHRDLTKHHSLIKTDRMSDIIQKSLQVDVQIASEYSSVEMMRTAFEEIWEETYQRVANEQEIYEAQLHDLLQLKHENNYLTKIAKQIAPYVRSIAKVKERLEPRLKETKDPKEDFTEKTHEDTSSASEMHSRSEFTACSEDTYEKSMDMKADNWTFSLFNEDPLLKTKEYCRLKQNITNRKST